VNVVNMVNVEKAESNGSRPVEGPARPGIFTPRFFRQLDVLGTTARPLRHCRLRL